MHQIHKTLVDVQLIIVEHHSLHTIILIQVHHLRDHTGGRTCTYSTKHRTESSTTESTLEWASKLSHHRECFLSIDCVVITVYIHKMSRGPRRLRELLRRVPHWRLRIISVDKSILLDGMDDRLLSVSGNHTIKRVQQTAHFFLCSFTPSFGGCTY